MVNLNLMPLKIMYCVNNVQILKGKTNFWGFETEPVLTQTKQVSRLLMLVGLDGLGAGALSACILVC